VPVAVAKPPEYGIIVVVCGSRATTDRKWVFAELDRIDAQRRIGAVIEGGQRKYERGKPVGGVDFLSREWAALSSVPLTDFTGEIYESFESHRREIPAEAYGALEKMKAENWLCSYGDFHGVATTLGRIGLRLRRPTPLAQGAEILEADYAGFHADFQEFFPELMVQVRNNP